MKVETITAASECRRIAQDMRRWGWASEYDSRQLEWAAERIEVARKIHREKLEVAQALRADAARRLDEYSRQDQPHANELGRLISRLETIETVLGVLGLLPSTNEKVST
jgi:rubrerythrin